MVKENKKQEKIQDSTVQSVQLLNDGQMSEWWFTSSY